jgi:hypothetical protein
MTQDNPLHQLGDGPVEARFREQMASLGRGLDAVFNGPKTGTDRDVGFVLMVFPLGDAEGRCNYISNGLDRHDVLNLLKAQAALFEAQFEEIRP